VEVVAQQDDTLQLLHVNTIRSGSNACDSEVAAGVRRSVLVLDDVMGLLGADKAGLGSSEALLNTFRLIQQQLRACLPLAVYSFAVRPALAVPRGQAGPIDVPRSAAHRDNIAMVAELCETCVDDRIGKCRYLDVAQHCHVLRDDASIVVDVGCNDPFHE